MSENETLDEMIPEDGDPVDPDERKREWEKMLAPARAAREQLDDLDSVMAQVLYEITLIEFGEEA